MVFSRKLRKSKSKSKSKKRKFLAKKNFYFVPHIFTLGNAFFGFCSVVLAAQGHLFAAAYFIFLGALMDAIDGRIARFLGSASDFGIQLDSLSDAISFCFAPAILAYFWHLKYLGMFGIIFCSIFFLAGLMRLARFNLISEQQTIFFLGIPSTIAGCFLTTFLLNSRKIVKCDLFLIFTILIILSLSYLMISSVPFPSFKRKLFNFSKNWYIVAFVMLFAIISIMQFHRVLLVFFILYFLSSFVIRLNFKK